MLLSQRCDAIVELLIQYFLHLPSWFTVFLFFFFPTVSLMERQFVWKWYNIKYVAGDGILLPYFDATMCITYSTLHTTHSTCHYSQN